MTTRSPPVANPPAANPLGPRSLSPALDPCGIHCASTLLITGQLGDVRRGSDGMGAKASVGVQRPGIPDLDGACKN